MNTEKTLENLRKKGYKATFFNTGAEALDYLSENISDKVVTFGGSRTLLDLKVRERLKKNNTVLDPDFPEEGEDFHSTAIKGMVSDVYMCSVNGLSENGEIVNIDAGGNRLAGTLYGHEKIYYVVGVNKITPDMESAIYRARNVASPGNCKRYGLDTACMKAKETKCYDCNHEYRLCRSLLIHLMCPMGHDAEVILINEELGF